MKGLLYSATDRLLAAFAEADAALYAIGGSSSAAKLARLREEYNSAKHQALEALFEVRQDCLPPLLRFLLLPLPSPSPPCHRRSHDPQRV